MRLRSTRGITTLTLLMAAASTLGAQGVTAELTGKVASAAGNAAIGGASVVIRNTETGYSRTVTTDDQGRFLAPALPVGPYTVTVTKSGFQAASNIKLTLNLGDAAPLNVKLAPDTGATVEIVASVSQVDADRASTAAFISPDALSNLPTFNRSFTSLATLTPQVTVESSRGSLAISGQRGVNTSINIDGGDVNEPFFGGATGAAEGKTPFTVSIEAIREYQVVTDGASAEFGRMGGGYVNAVTKSGTNDFGGSVFYYNRHAGLTSNNATLNGRQQSIGTFKQDQFGFSLGGPILKDKLFYFVAYDGQRRTDPVTQIWGGSQPVTLNPANTNDAALIARSGDYDSKSNSDVVFARMDWIINTSHALQLRVNQSNFQGDVGTGITTAYENTSTDDVKTLSSVLQWNWTIGANWLNEARINYVKDELPRHARTTIPQVQIGSGSNTVGFYGAYPFEREFETKRLEFQESLTYVNTTFQVKAGIDYNTIDISEVFASFYRGGYQFSASGGATPKTALENFEAGNWSKYTQRFGLGGLSALEAGQFDASEKQMAAFIQTDLRLSDTFKVGLGLRWDRQEHPNFPILDYSNPAANPMPLSQHIRNDSQFSPRLSFTWSPAFDQGKSVVRGSVGRYVSTTPSVFLYQAYTVNGVRSASIDFAPGTVGSTSSPAGIPQGTAFTANNPFSFSSLPTGASIPKTDLWTFSPDFKNPYTDRVNLGVERGFGSWVLGVSGTYAKSKNLERATDINLGTPTADAFGRLIFPTTRPNANYGKMAMYVSDAEGIYHAYTVSAKYQKEGSPFEAQAFYTYALDKDNDSNERNFSSYSTQNTQRLGQDWGWSDRDRHHVFTGFVSYLEQRYTKIQAGLAFRYQSGTPYSLTYGSDLNKDGITGNDRYMSERRNSHRNGETQLVDLKLSRTFRFGQKLGLQVSADVFNLFNRHNVALTDALKQGSSNDSNASLTKVQTGSTGRTVQLGARLTF